MELRKVEQRDDQRGAPTLTLDACNWSPSKDFFNRIPFLHTSGPVPALKVLAPTQSEPPFKVTQLAVLTAFVVLGTFAAIKFRNEKVRGA